VSTTALSATPAIPLSFAISRGTDRGSVELYRSGGPAALVEHKQAKKRLTFVRSGDTLLAMTGTGSLTSPDVLAQVVKGLAGRAESEPPM
jgi:hypothetical protein